MNGWQRLWLVASLVLGVGIAWLTMNLYVFVEESTVAIDLVKSAALAWVVISAGLYALGTVWPGFDVDSKNKKPHVKN